jgi:hypothetical protein
VGRQKKEEEEDHDGVYVFVSRVVVGWWSNWSYVGAAGGLPSARINIKKNFVDINNNTVFSVASSK